MTAHITRFRETAVSIAKETVGGRPAKALRRGNGGFADWVIIAIHAYKEREEETYRSVVDKLKVMEPIRELLDLAVEDFPNPSTLCKAMEALMMSLWRELLQRKTTLFDLGDTAAIDGTSFDRIAASRRYARRTDYRFLAAPEGRPRWRDVLDTGIGAVDMKVLSQRPVRDLANDYALLDVLEVDKRNFGQTGGFTASPTCC